MTTYKITLRSGRATNVDDDRSLTTLASDLAQDGFITVRQKANYAAGSKELVIMERAVESIEAAD